MSKFPIRKFVKRFLQILLILGFLGVTAFAVWLLNLTKPEAEKKETVARKPLVEVIPVVLSSHQINVSSKGVVQAKKRTQLAAELSGKVVSISPKFIIGGKFTEGETILEIDPSTYQSAISQAESTLVEAEVALTTEQARAEQARRDWARLGRGKPSSLTLRQPQIKSAESRIQAAKASLERANQDLQRTIIKAPFNATVAAKTTEIGNYLAPGSPIGEFFQTDPLEVRLPISLDELIFLETGPEGTIPGNLILSTKLGNRTVEWKAQIDRTEGQIDQQSRSIYLISDILPDTASSNPIQLQPGLFLDAVISGKTFHSTAKVPVNAFFDLQKVVLVDQKGKLEFREVDVLRRDGDFVYVSEGLKAGEKLCVTELPTMIEGTEVDIRILDSEESIAPNLIKPNSR